MQCAVCGKLETPSVPLHQCERCKSAAYCGRDCQLQDLKAHKKICKQLNPDIAQQVMEEGHLERVQKLRENAQASKLVGPAKRLWTLFENKANRPDEVVIREMKVVILRRTPREYRNTLMFQLLLPLAYCATKKNKLRARLTKDISPLQVLLKNRYVDPNSIFEGGSLDTPLQTLAGIGGSLENMKNQVILASQLLAAGADVNAKSTINGCCALHLACWSMSQTNLDFIKLLMDHGADPNAQGIDGTTPLMGAVRDKASSASAARFLMEYDDGPNKVNLDLRDGNGHTILSSVRYSIASYDFAMSAYLKLRKPEFENHESFNRTLTRDQFVKHQLEELEDILDFKGAIDGGWRGLTLDSREEWQIVYATELAWIRGSGGSGGEQELESQLRASLEAHRAEKSE